MISGFIKGQELTLTSPIIASGTIDYISANFIFFTNEWKDLDETWVHFQKGDQIFDAKVVNGKVDKSEHINLDNGEWSVYLHGNQFVNGEVIQRITTERQKLFVKESGVLNGEVFPSVNASTSEKFLAKANYAVDLAEKLRQDLENGEYSYTLTDEDIDEIVNIALKNIEENSSYVSSVTAFPETATEGDVVLLHRCNEISADDSNSGVVLDTAAIATLTLPERITDRVWRFTATNPTGAGFMLTLEQRVIEGDEPYVLTGISLASENYAGRWYWREGKPYNDIFNASTEPIPALIPLGKVSGFTATKDPLIDEDYDEHEDTDNTTIFRTVPREYMYSGGEWKLTERTDIAEGNLISDFGEIEKDGQKFYRLNLTDSRSLKNRNKKTVDIPISGVKQFTETIDGVTVNSDEIVFPELDTSSIEQRIEALEYSLDGATATADEILETIGGEG